MSEGSGKNIHQELIVAILKSGSAFTVPGGVPGETEQDYLTRLAVAASQLSDANWSAIPEWAQAWYDQAAKTMNAWYDEAGNQKPDRLPLATCPGMPNDAFLPVPGEAPAKISRPALNIPETPKTAQEVARIAPVEPPRMPQDQLSACLMAESTSGAAETVLTVPAKPVEPDKTVFQQTGTPARPETPRLPILDALHVILAEHLSDVASKPTPMALREELVRHGYRKLSARVIREECKSFARTVGALRSAGKME